MIQVRDRDDPDLVSITGATVILRHIKDKDVIADLVTDQMWRMMVGNKSKA